MRRRRLALEEPEPAPTGSLEPLSEAPPAESDDALLPMPSILVDEEDEIFKPAHEGPPADKEEEGLDIPDFLKS